MNKIFQLSTLTLLFASANVYAHHPAADIVDPDVYAMIEENISDAHLALTFDDMGSDTTDAGSAMEARDDDAGAAMGSDLADVGEAMEAREEMSAMSDAASGGQMGGQR